MQNIIDNLRSLENSGKIQFATESIEKLVKDITNPIINIPGFGDFIQQIMSILLLSLDFNVSGKFIIGLYKKNLIPKELELVLFLDSLGKCNIEQKIVLFKFFNKSLNLDNVERKSLVLNSVEIEYRQKLLEKITGFHNCLDLDEMIILLNNCFNDCKENDKYEILSEHLSIFNRFNPENLALYREEFGKIFKREEYTKYLLEGIEKMIGEREEQTRRMMKFFKNKNFMNQDPNSLVPIDFGIDIPSVKRARVSFGTKYIDGKKIYYSTMTGESGKIESKESEEPIVKMESVPYPL